MAKASASSAAPPARVQAVIRQLGRDLATARRRRRIPQKLLAERMLVSPDTLQRLEKGDPKVGLHVLAGALWAMGMLDRLADIAAPTSDVVGATEELARLPKRTRLPPEDPDLDF